MNQSIKFTALLIFVLAACDKPMKKFEVERNPNPRMHYQVTMNINKSPGPFDEVKGFLTYRIENRQCVSEDPISGVRATQAEWPEFELKKVSEDAYIGELYLDLFKGDDYYGLGVCQWKLQSITITPTVNGNTFYLSATAEEIQRGNPTSTYFLLEDYKNSSEPLKIFGAPLNENNKTKLDKFFSVTITGKEAF
ncbi:hypothetical protein [Dyella sp.]|uniref:hypothetical protein n=1 Tax=Dyella sp. TaxID=1869338 RepID=UPI002ED5A7CC